MFIHTTTEAQALPRNFPLPRIMHIISLVMSAILVLVGIHILMKEEEFKSELYVYWFFAIYLIIALLVKMVLVVHSDQPANRIILGFLVEFVFFLPIALNDWQADKQEFALAMLLTNVIRIVYYIMAVMKNSKLV